MYTHTKPKTEAEVTVIKRARQLTDFEWTPLRDIPTYTIKDGHAVIEAGKTVTGFPYSSTEETDKFVTVNVSFESFLSAIPNPDSTLYQAGHGAKGRCNYGIVCNGFVRYVFDIPYRVNTQCWYMIPGMYMIATKERYKVDDLKLCDILHAYNDGRNHVALITDLLTNEQGQVVAVEVSEGVAPLCKRGTYTPAEFYEKYRPFAQWRYEHINKILPFDETQDAILKSGIEKKVAAITVDYGMNSNYGYGEEILLSVFAKEPDVVEVVRDDKIVQTYTTNGRCFFPCRLEPGYYTARLQSRGDSVSFCVNRPEIRHEVEGDTITVYVNPKDSQSEIYYMDFRLPGERVSGIAGFEILTEEEKESGVIVRKMPAKAENFKIHFRNPYGVWSHRMIHI